MGGGQGQQAATGMPQTYGGGVGMNQPPTMGARPMMGGMGGNMARRQPMMPPQGMGMRQMGPSMAPPQGMPPGMAMPNTAPSMMPQMDPQMLAALQQRRGLLGG